MFRALALLCSICAAAYAQSAVFNWVRQVGGSNGQAIAGVATDAAGNSYIVGNTLSVDFPTQKAAQSGPGGSGLYRVDGPGSAWKNLPNSGFVAVVAMAANVASPSTIYAAGQPGLQRSTDGGATWTSIGNFPTAVNSVALDTGGAVYAATPGSGIFKSSDGGATFSAVNNGVTPDELGRLYFQGIWTDPANAAVVFAAQNTGLLKSTDGGASWQPILPFQGPVSLVFDRNTPGAVYAISGPNALRSADDGQTWSPLANLPAPFDPLNYLLVDPKTPGTLYGGAGGGPALGGLWKSGDNGQTWTRLIKDSATVMAADPTTGAVYAATGQGLLMSADGFQTAIEVGPPSLPGIASLLPVGGHLFIGAPASSDVFVTKLDPQGNTIYATYFGGASNDSASAMAVDANGAVYVTGATSSLDFPVTGGAFAKTGTSFLFKLNADGSVGYSTYFTTNSTPLAIAVDSGGHAFVAGLSLGQLPTTPGAYETTLQGSYPSGVFYLGPGPGPIINAFLTKFDANGASLVFSTYIGSFTAYANALALDASGNAYLAGGQTLYKMSPDGSSLLKTLTVNGTVWSLLADGAGNLYAGGVSSSGVPTTAGAFQTTRYGVPGVPGNLALVPTESGFITRYDANFNILNSTYLSGDVDDRVLSLAMASNGNVIAGGFTQSKAFPARGPVQSSFANGTGFIAELAPDLSTLQFSTFAGDTRPFVVTSVAPAADGGAIFGGSTAGPPSLFVNGIGAFMSSPWNPLNSGVQAFVVRAGEAPAMPRIDAVANAASHIPVALSPGGTFTVRGQGFGADVLLTLNGASIPLISQSATSLTAVAPPDLALGAVSVQVASGGASSNSVLVPVWSAAPGLFSADGSGMGQGYILNADGSLNSPSNPAKEGDPITIFATGVGSTSSTDGFAVLSSPPNVFVDGFYANGIAAVSGPVSGLPGNVYQISVYIPRPSDSANVNPNLQGFVMPPQVAVTLQVNGVYSQAGLALSVTH